MSLIKASEGKVFRRIADGTVYGNELYLGYTYIIGGEVLDEPHLDTPEDFEEIDAVENDVPNGNVETHNHENKSVLDNLSEGDDNKLRYNGISVGDSLEIKSVYFSNDWDEGLVDVNLWIYGGIDVYFNPDFSESIADFDWEKVVVVDVGIIYRGSEYTLDQLKAQELTAVDSIINIIPRPTYDEAFGMIHAAHIFTLSGENDGDVYFDLINSAGGVTGFNLYYIGG